MVCLLSAWGADVTSPIVDSQTPGCATSQWSSLVWTPYSKPTFLPLYLRVYKGQMNGKQLQKTLAVALNFPFQIIIQFYSTLSCYQCYWGACIVCPKKYKNKNKKHSYIDCFWHVHWRRQNFAYYNIRFIAVSSYRVRSYCMILIPEEILEQCIWM